MDDYQKSTFEDRPRAGCGCLGWFVLVVTGCFLACGGLCGGGYYAVFHSSWPLAQIESLLEESGDVEVEGLRGSISGGFHIDKLRMRNDSDQWSTLEEIDFEFNGVWNLVAEKRLIIDRFTVGRGEVYVSSSDESSANGDDQTEGDQSDGDSDEIKPGEMDGPDWKEIRVDLAEIADLKIIDEKTGVESSLGRLAFKDFHYLDGKVQSMGVVEIEDLIAKDDDLELVGLTGSTQSGFHIDRLAFRDAGDRWSHLDQIDFEFNGVSDLLDNQRLVIDRFSVAGGEVYTNRDWRNKNSADDETAQPRGDESAAGTDMDLKETRIDLIQVADLKLINSVTGVEFQLDEISIKGLQFEGDRVTALDDVTVVADHIDFRSGPSGHFADQPSTAVTRKFTGVLQAAAHESIIADIPFEVDLCFTEDEELSRTEFFDGRVVRYGRGRNQVEVICEDFTYTDYVNWKHGPLPSHVTGELTAVTDPDDREAVAYSISPGATFRLGELPFQVEPEQTLVMTSGEFDVPIAATHRTDTGEIRCRIFAMQDEPYWAIDLQSDDQRPRKELYADVLFGKPFDSLSAEQSKSLEAALQTSARVGEGE